MPRNQQKVQYTPTEVLFLISSQDTTYHHQLVTKLRNDIINQSHTISSQDYVIKVRILHEIFNHPGDWTILTALPHLLLTAGATSPNIINDKTKWIILCEESTHVELRPLLQKLSQENHTKAFYLGHPLYDQEATIIHHFAFFENPKWFPYPMLRSGVVFTTVLLKRMAALVVADNNNNSNNSDNSNDNSKPTKPKRHTDFTIDAAHELARFILDNVRVEKSSNRQRQQQRKSRRLEDAVGEVVATAKGHAEVDSNGISLHSHESSTSSSGSTITTQAQHTQHLENVQKIILKRVSYICPSSTAAAYTASKIDTSNRKVGQEDAGKKACAMYAKSTDTSTCLPVKPDEIYFAIKTCHIYHKERIPIIEATWAPYVTHKRYFSDVADDDIPTISVDVPNVEMGHCTKTLAILKLALKDIEQMNKRQRRKQHLNQNINVVRWIFLSDDDTLLSVSGVCGILGCFNALDDIYLGERYGYRLHAEDGFNYITGGGGIALSLSVVKLLLQHCTCPSESAPDDMILGSCLHSLQVKAIHSSRFHQARPNDYSRDLLAIDLPISFHKFWQLDPMGIYEQWFAAADRQMAHLHHALHLQQKLKIQNSNNESHRRSKYSDVVNCRKAIMRQPKSIESIAAATSDNELSLPQAAIALQHTNEKHLDL